MENKWRSRRKEHKSEKHFLCGSTQSEPQWKNDETTSELNENKMSYEDEPCHTDVIYST